jgi:CheY-like chemotaxis protein
MNGVIGFAEMLLDTKLTAEQLDYAQTINKSGEALIVLLNDILDFSKIEAGKLNFNTVDFDLETMIFDICDLIHPRLGDNPVELLCRIEDNVPAYIRSDAGRFRQVIVNLMGNASKFTKKGEIELALKVEGEKDGQIILHTTVRDTGIGIPQDELEKIFKVFQQVDGSITRQYEGTGLGLAICKQIAYLMKGDIWAESEEGVGSIFHFICRVDKSDKKAECNPKHDQLAGKIALIVDNNKSNTDILTHMLELSKMQVVTQPDPVKAANIINNRTKMDNPIDICILNIQAEGVELYDLIRQIKNIKSSPEQIPLVALLPAPIGRSKLYGNAGFDGCLIKPIRRSKLLEMIHRLIENDSIPCKNSIDGLFRGHSIRVKTSLPIRILLAENNEVNINLALLICKKAGYQVTVARNGREAVDVFKKNPEAFDLILMDVQMPGMDGREATKIIRKMNVKEIPIIAMTAEAMKGDREKCLQAGMDDYISKPIKQFIVYDKVEKWCAKR